MERKNRMYRHLKTLEQAGAILRARFGDLRVPPETIAVREALQQNRGFLFAAGMAASRLDPIAAGTLRAAPDDLARLGFAVARALSAGAPPVPGLSGAMEAAAQGIARALLAAGRPLVISGTASGSEDVIRAAGQVARALCESGRDPLLLYVMDECNSLGSGLLEGRPLEEAVDAVESAASTTVLVVENDLARRADAPLVERLFAAAGRLVVADHTASATSERADVVLPAASFAEAAGTYVNLEGRAQRAYAVMPPGGDVRSGWRWIAEMMRLRVAGSPAGQNGAAPDWRDLDDVASSMIDEVRALKVLRFLARPASFRLTGRKIPRQPHRSSGRTAVTAHRDVREPRPVDDPDSPLAYSMEGAGTTPPPALICREWAPGWNSAQAVNRLQSRVGGPLRGGDPGLRLLAPAGMDESGYTGDMPGAFEPRQHLQRGGFEALVRVDGHQRGDQRGVVLRQQQLAEELEALLRPGRDDDVVEATRHAETAHVGDDPLAQRQEALGHRVLQATGRGGLIGQDVDVSLLRQLDREQRRIGDAARERNDAGLVEQLQQLTDL